MLRIEVTADQRTVDYKSRDGKPASFTVQVAYVHLAGQKYPARIDIAARRDQAPYAPGLYTLSPESFYVGGKYGKLEFSPVLVPIAAGTASKAAAM